MATKTSVLGLTKPATTDKYNIADFNTNFDIIDSILSKIYPVNSIYISMNSANPSTYLGFGTWEQIKDMFLLACGNTYAAGSTGGEAEHKLTTSEMPAHNHTHTSEFGDAQLVVMRTMQGNYNVQAGLTNGNDANQRRLATFSSTSNNTGGGTAHNNMPPYLAVYVWKRTG